MKGWAHLLRRRRRRRWLRLGLRLLGHGRKGGRRGCEERARGRRLRRPQGNRPNQLRTKADVNRGWILKGATYGMRTGTEGGDGVISGSSSFFVVVGLSHSAGSTRSAASCP